jgi:uncharacterized membrane protein YsdA (DUF1294 family)
MVIDSVVQMYFIGINLVSFWTFAYDKYLAKKGRYRIPERYLHLLTSSGGFMGSVAGMSLFRHKTKKLKFITITMIITMIESFLVFKYLYI